MKIRNTALAFSAVIVLSLSFATVGQRVGTGRAANEGGRFVVTGKVYLPTGEPAVGAQITISGTYLTSKTTTGHDGDYSLVGVPVGSFTVTATVEGLTPQSESLSIEPTTPPGTIPLPIFLRNPGQKKGDFYSANPMFKDVPKEALDKFKTAFEKLNKDDPNAALPLLDEAITLHPRFAAAYYQKGLILFKKNDVPKALEAFVKAIEIKPDYLDAKYYFGVCHIAQRDFTVAEAVFRDVLQQDGKWAPAHMYLGVALLSAKKTDEAEAELKQAVSLKGGENLALAYKYLGGIYMQKKQNKDAAEALQKYVDLSPKAPDAEKIKGTIADLKKQG
jgi:Flp pilus assembly protein TadD